MKQRNKIICITMLLIISMATITPAMGSMIKADHQTNASTSVTIDFVDCTNCVPMRKEVTMTRTEWLSLQNDLQAISKELSVQDTLGAQLAVYQKHHLVSNDVTTQSLLQKLSVKMEHATIPSSVKTMKPSTTIILNAMCAILLNLQGGKTVVLGLNTFINLIGFDIVSLHKGYASTDITTTGVLGQQIAPPGNYVGTLFGFFGYWYGTKVKTGVYSDLTASGFTVFTMWISTQ
jgi:ethanolamine utilization microcompartment shell protein EutS